MNMKLSRRDKTIFLVVTVLVVIGLGVWFLLKPRYEDMQMSDERLVAKQAERDDIQARIDTLDGLKSTLKKKVEEIENVQKQFISEEDVPETQNISSYLMSLLEPSGIEIIGVNLADLDAMPIQEYYYNKRAVAYDMKINGDLAHKLPEEVYYKYNNNYPLAGPSTKIAGTVVTIFYTCDIDCAELFDAIQIVADHEKNIYLETCSAELGLKATSEGVEPIAEGELTITVYEIQPMDPADLDA